MRKAARFFHMPIVFYFFGFVAWWTLIVPTSIFIYMWIKNISELTSPMGTIVGDGFAVLTAITMIAFLANYIGMWIYLFSCDETERRYKILWAILFFLTAPIATIPYFFLVYRGEYSASSHLQSSQLKA